MTINLTSLKLWIRRLVKSLPSLPRFGTFATQIPLVPIESMFPLFERLDELSLYCHWFCSTDEKLHPTKPQWRLKRFTVNCIDVRLLRYCPGLDYFRLDYPTLWLTKD
ncbi:hypothetical protein BGX23_000919 [Mortierella sp. AD031]|nr:hypothetical protein BGX23_000919 [Mortierella sp. AD031]